MLRTVEGITRFCLFSDDASAASAVDALLALGLDESSVAIVGDAHTELTGKVPTRTLADILVPDTDLPRIMDALNEGGSIVAVQTTEALSGPVDEIFRRYSATDTDHFSYDPADSYEEPNRLDMIESEENE